MPIPFSVLCFFCSLLILPTSAEFPAGVYSVTQRSDGGDVIFDIIAKTLGWVGLGFNSVPSMNGADIVVAGVKDGQNYVYDLHGSGHDRPPADSQQDYKLDSASQNGTHTILSIRRAWHTGDTTGDFTLAHGSSVTVLWAIGAMPAKDISSFDPHSSRGTSSITLS